MSERMNMERKQSAEAKAVMDWLEHLIKQDYVARSSAGIFVWTLKGADHMAEIYNGSGGFNPVRDPNSTTPLTYCQNIAQSIDVATAKIFGGYKDESDS